MRLRLLLPAVAGLLVLPSWSVAATSRLGASAQRSDAADNGWGLRIERESAELAAPSGQKISLGPDDPAAALEALQRALDGVGDGQAYVWHRDTGPLWGVIHPTQSFRSAAGLPCRRLSLVLSVGEYTRTTDLVACRNPAGRWEISG